jgi:hypothetical protein
MVSVGPNNAAEIKKVYKLVAVPTFIVKTGHWMGQMEWKQKRQGEIPGKPTWLYIDLIIKLQP